jgi:hypothetical protein
MKRARILRHLPLVQEFSARDYMMRRFKQAVAFVDAEAA